MKTDLTTKYRCRNDFVLFKMVKRGLVRGLEMPDVAQQANDRVVIAVGPDVEDLKVGDKIMVVGRVGDDTVQLPAEDKTYMTKQANVALVEVE